MCIHDGILRMHVTVDMLCMHDGMLCMYDGMCMHDAYCACILHDGILCIHDGKLIVNA